jgi:hypothetical protein
MRRRIRLATILIVLAGLGAGTAALGQNDDVPPLKRKRLLAWLQEGSYRATYVAEPAVHPSGGPHGGNVRTYYNSILVEDLAAGRTTFRRGATMVKELYFSGTDEVVGYAVMSKVRRRSGAEGQGWLWLESFDGVNADFFGRGVRLCSDCHAAGTDFLLSPFRP